MADWSESITRWKGFLDPFFIQPRFALNDPNGRAELQLSFDQLLARIADGGPR
jgi:hypothetical protein